MPSITITTSRETVVERKGKKVLRIKRPIVCLTGTI